MKTKTRLTIIIGICTLILCLGFFSVVEAQENRSYYYESINTNIVVNKDSTFDVTEHQIYNYQGEYHQGWRSIPLQKISAITNVQVIDGASGQPLVFSSRVLDKTNPSSWGHYTYSKKAGKINIEWYYDLRDTRHEWVLKYKVHGGIGFLDDRDEIYWNLFTDYSVPVYMSQAEVKLPANNFSIDQLKSYVYWQDMPGNPSLATDTLPMVGRSIGGVYNFNIGTIQPHGKVTVAAGWPKGLIDKNSFWRDWLRLNWVYLLSFLIIISSIIIYIFYWYFTERYHAGRGTIIAQYEPPKNLPPAMADLIVRERLSQKAWPATIVDLAVRGYVIIKEEDLGAFKKMFFGKNFFIERTGKDEGSLHDFEKEFLKVLFSFGDRFSTRKMKSDRGSALELNRLIQKIEASLHGETDVDTSAYSVGLLNKSKLNLITIISFVALFFVLAFNFSLWPYISVIFCFVIIFSLVKYNPRLNKEGQILREDWLGFKLYLTVAERYRVQNLTPELFEKYLPYAMIFGIEKKWAKNFDSINIQPPSWYVGGGYAAGGGFSASAFSSSFSASFSSAFSSAGASGSSGGGGAGGGGGGGGGGAS